MKKTIAAITAGLLLIAGQAAASNNVSTVRVGDRIGASAGDSSEFSGVPIAVLFIGTAIVIAGIVALTDDNSESD